MPGFPMNRMRRLRKHPGVRRLVRETQLTSDSFIYPVFICSGTGVDKPVGSMPGVSQWSVDRLAEEAKKIQDQGIPALILFGIPDEKDDVGSSSWRDDGVVQQGLQALKKAQPGAPFGWTSEGTPYIGTQYCVDFRTPTGRLASLSTRNGGEAYHWQSLGGVSAKVASSALETHGRIDQLMAGESGRPCGEILSASDLATVRAAFVRVLGEEVVRQFEAAGEEAGEAEVKSEEAKSEVKREVKAEAGKAEAGREAETVMDKKRKARMVRAPRCLQCQLLQGGPDHSAASTGTLRRAASTEPRGRGRGTRVQAAEIKAAKGRGLGRGGTRRLRPREAASRWGGRLHVAQYA